MALAFIAEIPVVVCPFPQLGDIQLTDSKVFFILNLNGVFFCLFLRTSAWNGTDSPLCDLADVWNEVMAFHHIVFLLVRH